MVLATLAWAGARGFAASAGAGDAKVFALAFIDGLGFFLYLADEPANFARAGLTAASATTRRAGVQGRSPGNQQRGDTKRQGTSHGITPFNKSHQRSRATCVGRTIERGRSLSNIDNAATGPAANPHARGPLTRIRRV
jgi:hypothetical protein